MKKRKNILLFLVLSLILFSLSCSITTSAPIPDNTSTLATMVALTVEAAIGVQPTEAPSDAPPAIVPTEIIAPPLLVRPSALTVAYVKNGNVHVWVEGGTSVALTNSGDAIQVSISSDGQLIAYLRQIPVGSFIYELWVVNTTLPTNERLLISHAELEALKALSSFPTAQGLSFSQILWRPGTHQLAYGTVPQFEGPGYAPNEDIRLVNVDTLEKATLFDFGQGGHFSFAPDGTKIVFSTPDHISLANADGSNLHPNVVSFPVVGTYSEYQYHPSPIWAPDSASLRVAIPPEDTLAEPTPPTNLWSIPSDGSPATLLGNISAVPFAWPDSAFSPGLPRVAYVKSIGGPTENQRELHIANTDGSNDIIFASGTNIRFHMWTPDSTRFVYSLNEENDRGLYLAKTTGEISTITSEQNTVNQMQWVDNSRFLYIYRKDSTWQLSISDVDGTNHAYLDPQVGEYTSFDFAK
ncbi:MAG: hypothetical protein HN392_12940 [Anaerolineae bacterium]|jgi:Tol biopolymer transport system component|nr:hypothetical protein [Anaerolineae bacterium]MBT7075599.1 hypothetical protein [Anaerolineae bacterium]MBT7782406.1 hypothetical protein [Anaerolineae bacterium]